MVKATCAVQAGTCNRRGNPSLASSTISFRQYSASGLPVGPGTGSTLSMVAGIIERKETLLFSL